MNPLADQMSNVQNNPIYNQVMSMVKGKDPKDVFMNECRRRNVDPNNILNMMKKF